jgi:hypothetical protein
MPTGLTSNGVTLIFLPLQSQKYLYRPFEAIGAHTVLSYILNRFHLSSALMDSKFTESLLAYNTRLLLVKTLCHLKGKSTFAVINL